MRDRDLGGEAGVRDDQVAVDAARLAAGALVQVARTNGVTAWPTIPAASASATISSIRSVTSRLSSGGRPTSSARRRAPSARSATRAASAGVVDARGDGWAAVGRVEERQRVDAVAEHGDAERLEQLGRRRHVEERLHPGGRDDGGDARAGPRSAETSGGVGKPRCTPPRPPVPMKRIPTAAAAVSVPPTVVAPTAPCATHAARSRGPSLRASGVKRSSSVRVEPDREAAVEDADRGGHGAGRADGRLAREARPRPRAGAGKPCATSVVSSATTARPSASAASTSSPTRIRCSTGRQRRRSRARREPAALRPQGSPQERVSDELVVHDAVEHDVRLALGYGRRVGGVDRRLEPGTRRASPRRRSDRPLLHEGETAAVGVGEERDPELVGVVAVDDVRLVEELDPRVEE